MKIITMKLADLIKPEKNVRIHTEQQLKEFRRSIKMFGQIRPIVVDENKNRAPSVLLKKKAKYVIISLIV